MAGFLTNLISKMSAVIKTQSNENLSPNKHSFINYKNSSNHNNNNYTDDSNSDRNILSLFSYKKDNKKTNTNINTKNLKSSTLISSTTSYSNVTNPYQVEILFKKFRDVLIERLTLLTRTTNGSISYPSFFKDAGKSQGNKSYFFVQPFNQSGLLFEETSTGWIVSQARFNAEEKTYTKEKEILEQVDLFIPKSGIGNIRLNSQMLNLRLVTFSAYEDKILEQMELFLKNPDDSSFTLTTRNKEEFLG